MTRKYSDPKSQEIIRQEIEAQRRELLATPKGKLPSGPGMPKEQMAQLRKAQEEYNKNLKNESFVEVVAPEPTRRGDPVYGPHGMLWTPGEKYRVRADSPYAVFAKKRR